MVGKKYNKIFRKPKISEKLSFGDAEVKRNVHANMLSIKSV